VTAVVDKVGPAVVRIDASKTVTSQTPEVFNDPFFRQFFVGIAHATGRSRLNVESGSGFVIGADGFSPIPTWLMYGGYGKSDAKGWTHL